MRSLRNPIPDDRTVRARVRDAAIEVVAEGGVDALTARAVAGRAGVSPGSVINNFGSMDGLRRSCDDHVVGLIARADAEAMAAGASLDLVAALREARLGPVLAYLAAVLADDSPAVADMVDRMVEDAVGTIAAGVQTGLMRPVEDIRGRAVVLTITSLGTLVLHRHVSRLLGVDLIGGTGGPESLAGYLAPLYELYTTGLFTEEFGAPAVGELRQLSSGTAQSGAGDAREPTRTATEAANDSGGTPGREAHDD